MQLYIINIVITNILELSIRENFLNEIVIKKNNIKIMIKIF